MLNFISCQTLILWCVSLLLSFSLFIGTTCATNETDRLALLAIKSQLHAPLGVTSSWNNSVNLCLWTGVTCGRRHRRVTVLDLSNQNIRGYLSPYIGNLSFLRSINVRGNNLNGEIPQEVGRLFRLQTLILSNNSFSGTIPTNLSRCSNLIKFLADYNNLVGAIPAEIGYLLKVEKLSIGDNDLTGRLPAFIGNLSALQWLNVKGNRLSGEIPSTVGQLKSLVFLNVNRNNFSGMIPLSIYNISSLEVFSLLSNGFNGSLLFNIGITLPNLDTFIIAQNNFTGSVPDSFSNASKLVELDLDENQFSGKVSIEFRRLKDLSKLNLGLNNLGTGKADDLDFINTLTNCSKLERHGLYVNQFGGVLPRSIANLSTTMTGIAIGFNQISGTIPSGIGNLANLNVIGMEFNQLTGSIPLVLGELRNLQALSLHENNFQGSIPISLGNLTLLTQLDLAVNRLQGNIPSSLGSCQNLMQLLLQQNKLTGSVPQQILQITTLSIYLDLSNNLLSGPFPSAVGNLKNLVVLDISRNYFSGHIPTTLGGCTSLEYLYMQNNSFRGSIPSSLSSLRSIKKLDLSHNNLSDQIPKYLENLSFLEYLNLSYNHFEGEIPTKGVLSNTTEISLIGNEKLCGGLDELHLPSCHSKGSKKLSITLLKLVIPVITSCLILLATFIVIVTRRRRSTHKSSSMLQMEEQFPMVSYAELRNATNEFSLSNMIGQGSYGFVYKGILGENEMLVAVKVLNLKQKGASRSFMAECEALRNIRHRNLIKIMTVYSSLDFQGDDFKALVYEYMQNGSLEEWLHQTNDQLDMRNLSLIQRLSIAIDVASAIEYLHHHCQPPILHGDLKPSNVLLDHDFVAHVGDFGLARFLCDRPLSATPETQSSSIGIKGTVGYVAPEYGMGGQVSMSGDVYSFGILLLELIIGRRPTDRMFNDGLSLHEFAKMALPDKAMEIIEPSLLLEARLGHNVENFPSHEERRVRNMECLVAVIRIGVLCSMESPIERMDMSDVAAKLLAVGENFRHDRI